MDTLLWPIKFHLIVQSEQGKLSNLMRNFKKFTTTGNSGPNSEQFRKQKRMDS